jgi:ATP/ADP translocase/HEAT repeat protein
VDLLGMRAGERRDAWAAFLTLFGLIGSHTVLETARDALFLAKVPATELPWVFLAVAAVSFALVRLQALVSRRLSGARALMGSTLLAAAVTFAFFQLSGALGRAGLYALYVWSGVLTTLLLVHFWTLLGNIFSVTQAKRLFGFIGAGSVLGAIAGSGAVSALSRVVTPRTLIAIAAGGFLVSTFIPALFHRASRAGGAVPKNASSFAENLRYVRQSPYARQVVLSLLASTMCLTVGDFLFKSMVAALVPKAELSAFLGSVYFALNIASLVCQLLLVGWLLKRVSLGAALAVLPLLLALGGLGVAVSGGLIAVLGVKAADGAFRYSLHRTATELLYLPFSDEARQRVKGFIDVVGQRGGQVIASLAILALAAFHASPRLLALLLVALAAVWMATAVALRRPYLELFRARLESGRVVRLDDFPELDVASLETLIAALDSNVDREVIAALQVLEREQKVHLVPALILYHPADAVVEQALAIFTRAGRKNVVHVIDRVLDHPSARVRAASIAARSVLQPDPQTLLMRMSTEESQEVRATITVNLIATGDIYGADAKERIDALLRRGTSRTKIALAEAIASRGAAGFSDVLATLSSAAEPEVRRAAVLAMGRVMDPRLVQALIARLADESTRQSAEQVLLAHGDDALQALIRTLDDETQPAGLRWRIPHAVSIFDPARSAAALLARLPEESDGSVRYQLIRALERIVRRNPKVALDRAVLDDVIDRTIRRAFRLLDSHLILTRGAAREPSRRTPGHDLLRALLVDKEKNTIERLFRLVGLAHPSDDFAEIHRGLTSSKDARATSIELVDNLLVDPLRSAILALVDDVPPEERLARSGRYHRPLGLDYEGLLSFVLEGDSEAAADITAFHIAELGLAGFREKIAPLPNSDGERGDVTRALAQLALATQEPT